jgi:uncharacterized protein YecE (DUF72 family)
MVKLKTDSKHHPSPKQGIIRVGIGGWNFAPWRGTFYPEDLAQRRELEYAACKMTAIEVNATYYKLQTPKSFATWAKAAPDNFIYALKASRFCTNRTRLAEAGEAVAKFLDQGIVELGDKLGPILWQFMPAKKFDPTDFKAFLELLPGRQDGVSLRHAVEVRHESFNNQEFIQLAQSYGVAVVSVSSPEFPNIASQTADFTYARLLDAREEEPNGYDARTLDKWAETAQAWSRGKSGPHARDVFMFVINGAKIRAPAAALELIKRLQVSD